MISIGFASGSTPGKRTKNAWYKDYVCVLFRKNGRSSQRAGKIDTAWLTINYNRLTDLFLRNKAIKTGLWFSGKKNAVCLQLNVVCLF